MIMETLTNKTMDSNYNGPYKATRLWNDVIGAFRQYVPCGRHRRYMKTFDNCFSGTSATEWLLQYLKNNSNFNEDVSRGKALSLLNKLYKAGIFEEVQVSKSMRHKQDVQENRLYKFLPASPSKMKIYRLPLAPRNDSGINRLPLKEHSFNKPEKQVTSKDKIANVVTESKLTSRLTRKISILKKEKSVREEEEKKEEAENFPPCHLVARVLTTREIKDTWRAIFIQRVKNTISVSKLSEIMRDEDVDGYNVMHNCIYLNKSGVVTNIDVKEQLPQWVMSAMKCLARWPEPPEPGLPNYPGFEKDVFGVVKEYFLGLEEPLIPYRLYDVFINVFVMAGSNQPRHSSPHHNDQHEGGNSLWTSASLENIILNFTRKYCLLDSIDQTFGTREDIQAAGLSKQQFGTQEDLRFVSHMDKSYFSYNNRKVFPSTDGMDELRPGHKSNYKVPEVNSFPPLSSFKSCHALSKTTHSAGEAWSGSNHDRSGLRKYGSTPNLKVSRYETAFGPDNRTVTRIFYQNGMTTDYGHDEDDDLYHLPLGHTTNQEKQSSSILERSTGSMQGNQKVSLRSSPATNLSRSKSHYDVTAHAADIRTNQNTFSLKHNTSLNNQSNENIKNGSFVAHNGSFTANNGSFCNKKSGSYQNLNKEKCGLENIFERDTSFSRTSSPPAVNSASKPKCAIQLSRTPSLIEAFGPGYRPMKSSAEERLKHQRPVSLIEFADKTPERKNDLQLSTQVSRNPPVAIDHWDTSMARHRLDHHSSTPHLQSPNGHADTYTPELHLSHITPFCSTNGIQNRESNFMNFPRNRLSEERAMNSLKIVSLLLPPSNRRKLHLLFKMMTKMTSNPNLFLDYTQTTRSLVLSTFYKSIICSQEDSDLDDVLVLQLVSFMLDFYAEIFTPPSDIKAQVSTRLKAMQRPQVVYSPRPDRTVRFCQQTTVTDYENQRKSTSEAALEQLLEGIVSNKKLDTKEKKKHLRQFQKTYPTIYANRFPTPDSEAAVLGTKSMVKKSSKSGSLHRLRGLRL